MKKFILTETTITWEGRTLHRIQAIRDFGDVKKGDIGGYIEKEKNLSQEGNCWVYKDSYVYDESFVDKNAKITGFSHIFCGAYITDNAVICDAVINGVAKVSGNASINGATVTNSAIVKGNSIVYQCATICNSAIIDGHSIIGSGSHIGADYDMYDKHIFEDTRTSCVIEENISSYILKQTAYCNFVTVFNNRGKDDRKPSCKLIRYIVSNPLVNIKPQICYSLSEAREMDKILNEFRYNVSKAKKCFGTSWDKNAPMVCITCTDCTEHMYSFKRVRKDEYKFVHEEWKSFGGNYKDFERENDRCIRARYLTVSKNNSANKNMLSITDWLYKR